MLKAVGSNRIVNGGQLKYAAKNKNIVSIQCPINVQKNNFDVYDAQVATINKAFVAFKGYYGDKQPLKKLFWICTNRNDVYEDNWAKDHIYNVNGKKWINAKPNELLRLTPERTLQSLCTIIKPDNQYPEIPSYIPSPNYGNKWGRQANYIEINPRTIAKYDNGRVTEGLLNAMKIMLALPTSPNSFANCIVLSQLYPSLHGDGTVYADSLYCANLHSGISQTLTCDGLYGKMGADEQVKAFNDMAHLLGFKTAFRMPLASNQLKIQGQPFNWYEHEKAYIDACIWGIELGFDSIYFDSGKHVVDPSGYMGSGDTPNKEQMAYITYQIRKKTGRDDISFIGEKCDSRIEFKQAGYTAGTDWGRADDFESIRWEAQNQKWMREYAAGPEVSNDNDTGSSKFDTQRRLNRINNCLFGYDYKEDKLPSYMQLTDIIPLSPYTNTHEQMLHAKEMQGSDAWTECERHYDGVFDSDNTSNCYTTDVYHIFENVIRCRG